jgi:uncharacterized protein YecT (DUF1311 family)
LSLFVFLMAALSSANAHSASFECHGRLSLVESLICADPELSTADDEMAELYRSVLRRSDADTGGQLKVDQRSWLLARNACKSKECLVGRYADRAAQLREYRADRGGSGLPSRVGECRQSVVTGKQTRFEGATPGEVGGEVGISFGGGLHLYPQAVSDLPPKANVDRLLIRGDHFLKGDRVTLCLVSKPKDCPPGDDRGKIYSVENMRNSVRMKGVDSWHMCGGA